MTATMPIVPRPTRRRRRRSKSIWIVATTTTTTSTTLALIIIICTHWILSGNHHHHRFATAAIQKYGKNEDFEMEELELQSTHHDVVDPQTSGFYTAPLKDGDMDCKKLSIPGAEKTSIFCTFRIDVHEGDRSLWKQKQQAFRDCSIHRDDDSKSTECVQATVSRQWLDSTTSTTTTTTTTSTTTTTTTTNTVKEPKASITVGDATYTLPYKSQYGTRVGRILLQYPKDPTDFTDWADWYLELGHAHMDDAEYGVSFQGTTTTTIQEDYKEHPKAFHHLLAIQAYTQASKATEFSNAERYLRLLYLAVADFALGDAHAAMAETQAKSKAGPTDEERAHSRTSLLHYKDSWGYYKRLEAFTNEVRLLGDEHYNSIQKGFAYSCTQVGMGLYRNLVDDINEATLKANEKTMEVFQTQMQENEIMDSLLGSLQMQQQQQQQQQGRKAFVIDESALQDLLVEPFDKEQQESRLQEITSYLDVAIAIFEEHAKYPSTAPKRKVLINGVPPTTKNDDRLFDWRASLALGYQNAALVATTREDHSRAFELMTKAADLYTTCILPYYEGNKKASQSSPQRRATSDQTMLSSMTLDYAKTALGDLYHSMAETSVGLGKYASAKSYYQQSMNWHDEQGLPPKPDGIFDSLDPVAKIQYREIVQSYEATLEDLSQQLFYKDEAYESEVHMALAPMYMAMGKAHDAVRAYEAALKYYQSLSSNDQDEQQQQAEKQQHYLLSMTEAVSGIATAKYHSMDYSQSYESYSLLMSYYQKLYGEGTPPKSPMEVQLEYLKDQIVKEYGKGYYEKLQSHYGVGSSKEQPPPKQQQQQQQAGIPKITNFHGFSNNETLEEIFGAEEDDDYDAGGNDDDDTEYEYEYFHHDENEYDERDEL